MSIGLKKNIAPIKQIQTQISDFSDNLKPFCNLLEEKLEGIKNSKKSEDSKDNFILLPGNLVRLRNEKCREYNIPLTKNGTDNRTICTGKQLLMIFKKQKTSI